MVVRPQRGRVLPDRGFSRHDVLLPAQTRRPANFLLPDVDHQLLGHHLPLHVGGIASPALHGAAALGADTRNDLLGDAAGAVVGICRQCAAHAQRRLGQGPRRRDIAFHDGRGRVLWTGDIRGIVHRGPAGQFSLPLHGLDGRPCPCRRAGLGRDDHLRGDLCVRALALEKRGHVFGKARRGSFLVRCCRDHHLCLRDVELRHHPGSDVADLQRKRDARLFICRFACRDAARTTSRVRSAGFSS